MNGKLIEGGLVSLEHAEDDPMWALKITTREPEVPLGHPILAPDLMPW
jgi:hypothetical protein